MLRGGGSEFSLQLSPPGGPSNAGKGGVTSSKIGCLPVCYIRLNDPGDRTLDAFRMGAATDGSDLWLDRSNDPPEVKIIRIGVTYQRNDQYLPQNYLTELNANKTWNYGQLQNRGAATGRGKQQLGTHLPPTSSDLIVRVSNDQESCVIEDTSTSEIVYQGRRN